MRRVHLAELRDSWTAWLGVSLAFIAVNAALVLTVVIGYTGLAAVAAGLALGRIRARLGLERLVALGCLVFALVMLVAAFVWVPAVVYGALALGGAALEQRPDGGL